MTFVSRNVRKTAILSSLPKLAKHILLLGSLNVSCKGISSVHTFSRYMHDPCHSNTAEENTTGDKN